MKALDRKRWRERTANMKLFWADVPMTPSACRVHLAEWRSFLAEEYAKQREFNFEKEEGFGDELR